MLPRHVQRELRLLRSVRHPCVVSLKDVVQQVGDRTGFGCVGSSVGARVPGVHRLCRCLPSRCCFARISSLLALVVGACSPYSPGMYALCLC